MARKVLTIVVLAASVPAMFCPASGQTTARSAPATHPATFPASRLAEAKVPEFPAERIAELVRQLSDEKYRMRQAAQNALIGIVELPGVAEALKTHLKAATDADAKAALEAILDGWDLPVAILDHRGGLGDVPRLYGPWLFVNGDGGFIYDAAGILFSGKDAFAGGDFRQGRLTVPQLLAVKDLIAGSGVAKNPSGHTNSYYGGGQGEVAVSLYVRSGKSRSVSLYRWAAEALRPGQKGGKLPADVQLAAALRDTLAACPSRPYAGKWALHVEFNPQAAMRMKLEDRKNLPDWPVEAVALESASPNTPEGLVLTDAQLEKVKAALAKTSLYKIHRILACQAWIAPCIEPAGGPKKDQGQ